MAGIISLSGSLTPVGALPLCSGTADNVERRLAAGECTTDPSKVTTSSPSTSTSSGSSTSNVNPCTGDTSSSKCCGGVATSIIGCTQTGSKSDVQQTGLWGVLLIAINILSAGVGVLAVAGIVYGAIMYTSAGGSAEQTKKAIGIITNVVIGVVAYALMYAVLNFLVPGGLFN